MSKRIIAGIIAGILVLGITGCSNKSKAEDTPAKTEDTAASTTETKKEEAKDVIKSKDQLLELGKSHVDKIGAILDKYKVKEKFTDTGKMSQTVDKTSEGYFITPNEDKVAVNDGAENNYMIRYSATVNKTENSGKIAIEVTIQLPIDREFKLEECQMLKEIIQVMYDGKYDAKDTDKWVNDYLKGRAAGTTVSVGKDTGIYREALQGGVYPAEKIKRVIYSFMTPTIKF